jgi:hypothetical protein
VYTALITQAGTSAPTATVLENTFAGTITYAYLGVGQYKAILSGAFTLNKTAGLTTMSVPHTSNADHEIRLDYPNVNEIYIFSIQNATLTDDNLNRATIEFRVYN